jgi:hypothetical protein
MKRILAACLFFACSAAPPQNVDPNAPKYTSDVAPILQAKCVACHTTGGIAPFSLETYEGAKAQATAIKTAVTARIMPPWPPADSCNSYAHDRSLTQDQIDTIAGWVDGGAQKGDPNAKPSPLPSSYSQLSRTDLTLSMPAPYTPQLVPDDYRCFLVDWPAATTKYVTGLGIKPGDVAIVHHAIVFLATPNQLAMYQNLDAQDAAPGWSCFGGPGADLSSLQLGWVGAWAPGTGGADFPDGTGIEIPPGSKLVLQMHYNTLASPPAPDLTSVLLKVDDTVQKKAAVIPFADPAWVTNQTMNIPPSTPDAMHSYALDLAPYASYLTNGTIAANQPFTIYDVGLHMHTHGTHATTSILRKDQTTECMLDIPRWDFHWQGSYGLSLPKVVNPGDQLSVECHWANGGTSALNWGETTEDEMCLAIFYATQ